MTKKIHNLIARIKDRDIMLTTTKSQLNTAIELLDAEIGLLESCNLQTKEMEHELIILRDARCRCRQRLSILKED